MKWIVARTRTGSESWAAENIRRQGVECYLPKVAARPGSRRTQECLFPGYVFVRTEGRWRFLTGTYGVVDVVMQGEHPAVLRDRDVDWVRAMEGPDGLVVLPELPLRPGDRLRVVGGVFATDGGIEVICDGMKSRDRVYVLLNVLGDRRRVEMGLEDVTRVD